MKLVFNAKVMQPSSIHN